MFQVGDREFTLDDCWGLELNTRTHWFCVQEGTMEMQVWKGADEEGSEFDDMEDDEEDGEDEEDEEEEED
ncbi:unnamed protein product, partial [Discosporangium mesarthrocarpum]